MADHKLFVGPRLRRARQELGLTQAAMAASLGISPSYLNLIERNQRPLTAQVLMALSGAHGIDVSEFAGGGGAELEGLREAFADPLLSGEFAGPRELIDMADAAPAASAGVAKLYRAYREALSRLSEMSGLLSGGGAVAPASLAVPADRFRALVEEHPHHFPELDDAAERVAAALPRRSERANALAEWLEGRGWTLRGLPAEAMPHWHVHSDRHAKRLYLSDAMNEGERTVAVATEVMRWAEPEAIALTVEALTVEALAAGQAKDVMRLVHAHVLEAAGCALAMPYRPFHEEAARMRHDAAALAARFRVGVGHAAWRIVSLRRINASAPPAFAMAVAGGHPRWRVGATGFPRAFAGPCPVLPVHAVDGRSGQRRVDTVAMPDGRRVVAASFGTRRGAVMLGMAEVDAASTIYADGGPDIPAGPSCRLCERRGCGGRLEPPFSRPTVVDEWKRGPTRWEFQ